MATIVLAMIAVRIITAMVVVQVLVIVLLALFQQLYTVFRGRLKRPAAPPGGTEPAVARQEGSAPQVRRQPLASRRVGALREPAVSTAVAGPLDSKESSRSEAH